MKKEALNEKRLHRGSDKPCTVHGALRAKFIKEEKKREKKKKKKKKKTSHAVKFNTTTYTIGNGVNKFKLHTQPIFISSPTGILVTYLDV